MTGAATTAQWLTCAGIGTGTSAVVLGLLKLAIDGPPEFPYREPPAGQPPALPAAPVPAAAPAAVSRPRHAGPPAVDETQPITCLQPTRARHSKGPAWN
ncbi:hypothetical protein [Streptomyces sp. NPDC050263]|uniref:hypothetical protein n=1 Tax=Streptomyces sp. NPDC050263 TaxID=3155037 RepID=UPI003422CB51